MLYRLSYARGGRRDSNPQPQDPKEPLPAPQADGDGVKERDNRRDIVLAARPGFEPGLPGSEPGVVPLPPPRIVWTGGLEPPIPGAGALPLRHVQLVLTAGFEPALTAV